MHQQFGSNDENPVWKRYMREPLRFGKRFADGSVFRYGGATGGLINPFLYEAYRSGGDPFQKWS